jgi:hypothetical protein
MALRMFAVALLEGLDHESPAPATELIAVRDLGAVVEEVPYVMIVPDDTTVAHHHAVVSSVFARTGAVLPAPANTIFREKTAVRQWLELHYVALNDALAFVEDRVEARVHVRREDARAGESDAGSDLADVAAELFRTLRRQAVASIPLRTEHLTGVAITSAFLVERGLWKEFSSAARDLDTKDGLSITVTGPWPAYDFVRIHFAG